MSRTMHLEHRTTIEPSGSIPGRMVMTDSRHVFTADRGTLAELGLTQAARVGFAMNVTIWDDPDHPEDGETLQFHKLYIEEGE